MNAALLAACAANSRNGGRRDTQPVYILPETRKNDDRPVIGMLKVKNSPHLSVREDLKEDGCEFRFRSVYGVIALIRDLEELKENMLVLEGGEKDAR